MIDFHLMSLVYGTQGISMTKCLLNSLRNGGPGPGPLVQNMVNIGPGPRGAPGSQRVNVRNILSPPGHEPLLKS